jgi:hypothetical protein
LVPGATVTLTGWKPELWTVTVTVATRASEVVLEVVLEDDAALLEGDAAGCFVQAEAAKQATNATTMNLQLMFMFSLPLVVPTPAGVLHGVVPQIPGDQQPCPAPCVARCG